MSDLQCAATLLIARHGEAEYETELLTDAGGSLTRAGRAQAVALAESLAGSPIALVYTSALSRAVQTAEIVAARTGAGVAVREGLAEWSVGEHAGTPYVAGLFEPVFEAWESGDVEARVPGSESCAEIRDRVGGVLREIADLHRGETVLVVSHTGAIQTTVPALVGLPDSFAASHPVGYTAVVEVAVDGDGWVLRSWPEPSP